MDYTTMLNEIIENSGKMLKDIARECEDKYHVPLSPSNLSMLKSKTRSYASDEVSRTIAIICGAKYPGILVVQKYLEKCPKEIIDFLEGAKQLMNIGQQMQAAINGMPAELIELSEPSLAEFICEYAEELNNDANEMQNEWSQLKSKPSEPQWLVIPPDVAKSIKFINDSDMKKITEE